MRAAPIGVAARHAWYLYELLLGRVLKVHDAPPAAAIDVLDPKVYFTGKPRLSKRHRVRDNLLGTGRFCPIVRRTKTLTEFLALDLGARRAKRWDTPVSIWWRAPPVSCRSPTAAPASSSGRAPAAQPVGTMGPRGPEAGEPAHAGRNRSSASRPYRGHTIRTRAGLRPDGVFLRRARPP